MIARVSESNPTATVGLRNGVGVDLGRHRIYAGAAAREAELPIPLSEQHDGLLVRWAGTNGPERVTERLLALAGHDQQEAIKFVALVAHQVIRGLSSANVERPIQNLAIPCSLGPLGRQAVRAGFERAGMPLRPEQLIERPLAALAGWLAHREQISGHPAREPVLLIDNDGGELSAVVADPESRQVLACMPLSQGPQDNPDWVVERLKELIASAAGLLHQGGIIQHTDWPSISATLPQVVVTGSGHAHPAVLALIRSLLPAADIMPDPFISNPAHCVVLGLQHLHQFDGWRACWPTHEIRTHRGTTASELVVDAGQVLWRQGDSSVVQPGSLLQFGSEEAPLKIRSGSVLADALVVPSSIGPLPTLHLLPDGRMSIRGLQGTRPLTVHLAWPCPGSTSRVMTLRTVSRRASELV